MEAWSEFVVWARWPLRDPLAMRRRLTHEAPAYIGLFEFEDEWAADGSLRILRQPRIGPAFEIGWEVLAGPVPVVEQRSYAMVEPRASGEQRSRLSVAREIWMDERVRLYLDEIAGVATCMTVELVAADRHSALDARETVQAWARRLELSPTEASAIPLPRIAAQSSVASNRTTRKGHGR